MIYWSLRTLLAEPMRLLISASAVALSFILVIFFSAVFEGESDQMVLYLEEMDADVWVMQKGVSNMHMASSMIWDWKVDQIAEVPGVKDLAALLYFNGPVKVGGKDWFSYVFGISPRHSRAGPWAMAGGQRLPGPGEAVIPKVISQLTGAGIGDTVSLGDRILKIVGLSRDTFSMASSVVFVSREDLGVILEGENQFSYVMVYADPGVDAGALAERIEQEVDKVNALTSTAFIDSDRLLAVQMGAEIVRMMTLIGTVLATLIVAFTAYSMTARKKREFAIAKALGFRNSHLYRAAFTQSLVVTAAGLLGALAIAFALLDWLPSVAPQINLAVRLHQFIPVALVGIPISVLASAFAVRTVAGVDPTTVFQQ